METPPELRFKCGEYLFQEKMACSALFIVKSGHIQVFRWNRDRDQKVILGIVGPGEYLGELSLLSGQPHSSNAMALDDVAVLSIKKEAIEAQLKTSPSWLVALVKGLVSRLQRSNEILRRNNLIDENLAKTAQAIEDNHKRNQKAEKTE